MKDTNTLQEIQNEVQRQNEKWGEQNHSMIEWQGILMEEVGEAAKEAVDFHFENKKQTYRDNTEYANLDQANKAFGMLQRKRIQDYRNELIQVAAVAVQMIDCLDRNGR